MLLDRVDHMSDVDEAKGGLVLRPKFQRKEKELGRSAETGRQSPINLGITKEVVLVGLHEVRSGPISD